ncbi:MAG TPA: 4-(cytidine 5'-diphospho)-2-C-methyl-D-erythritol kinase [Elusimicrobiota bacterium]|jgi:4-diphosphocytidyl-2-C-methyl-D-erythritol kinase|nr:4-(cytidine 5'-diphospho)-2-C-methyl-D-erythritol kinase [Elusimicrobiota bacterium]
MSPLAVQVPCPAKVNLFLEVTGKRKDGYHTLATLFAKISVYDVVEAAIRESPGFELEIVPESGQPLSAGPDNLVLRAAEAFRKEFRLGLGARLRLIKRIPMGAGLGGGSSDAAGTLLALTRLFGMENDAGLRPRLKKLAAKLGADVPVFLNPHPICAGRGIGDRLSPVRAGKALPWMVLVFPGVEVPTKEVFGRLVRPGRSDVLTNLSHLDKLTRKLEKGRAISDWKGHLFNRLESEVLPRRPEVRQAKEILIRSGLEGVLMSGSGSSVFGFAASHAQGERALERLRAYPWKVFLASGLG